MSGIMKVGSVYFMAAVRLWRAAIHLFLRDREIKAAQRA